MDKPFPEAVQDEVVLQALYIGMLVAGVLIVVRSLSVMIVTELTKAPNFAQR